MSGGHLSKDFFDLVKAIGESKSKQEEDRIIVKEVAQLKRQMQEKETSKKRQKEFVIRLLYVEMLGHEASFGYIKAVELTASTNLIQKRVAYLCCCQCLSPSHEFRFMVVNQLQRDMQSSNHLEVCAALMAVCKLVTVEMIPAVQPIVTELLRHDTEIVRKKAIMALQQFFRLNPDSVSHLGDQIRRTLCDPSPSVMGATLCILYDLAVSNGSAYKDLVPSYVSILKQITEHRLPREFDYHRIPAPWIQIRLLKILALLGQADQQASEGMYEVLHDVMRRADTGINVGYAIIYECVRTITTIYPNSTLLDAAASSISRFISSDNHNLKYLGVTGLAAIVKDHPKYASAHQMAVIDCLEDPDESLKRKTLDLLFRMTNPVNVEFITDKLTQFLRETNDEFLKKELVERITQCAERFAPSNAWYIRTMTNVFELGGTLVKDEDAHNLLRLIAEGSQEDDDEGDLELRRDAVETYLMLLDKPTLPDILAQVMAWTLGEYGHLSESMRLEEIAERLCELLSRTHDDPAKTRGYILNALTKITAQLGTRLPVVEEIMEKYSESQYTDLQQRCYEYKALAGNLQLMKMVLPPDSSCEEIEVDPNLEFLRAFVDEAVGRGMQRYNPPLDEDEEDDILQPSSKASALKLEAYERPTMPTAPLPRPTSYEPAAPGAYPPPSVAAPPPAAFDGNFKKPAKQVWGQHQWGASNSGPPQNAGPSGPASTQPPYGAPPAANGGYGYGNNPYGGPPPGQPPISQPTYDEEEEEEDEQPAPLSEKERAAAMLFGGVPGAQVPPPSRTAKMVRPGGRGSRSTSARSTAPAQTAPPVSAGPGGHTRKPSGRALRTGVQPQAAQPPASVAPPTIDLLDISFDSSPPTGPPSQVPDSVIQQNSQPYSADSFNSAALYNSPSNPPPQAPTNSLDPFASMQDLSLSLPQSSISSTAPEPYQFSRPVEPAVMSTPEFGSLWGKISGEVQEKVPSTTVRTLADYGERLKKMNLYTVESIVATNEAIASAKMAGTDTVCLVHGQLRGAGFIQVKLRCPDPGFAQQILSTLQQGLR